jgi:hypothetical protein
LLEEGITYFKPTFEEFDNTWYSQTTYKTWI